MSPVRGGGQAHLLLEGVAEKWGLGEALCVTLELLRVRLEVRASSCRISARLLLTPACCCIPSPAQHSKLAPLGWLLFMVGASQAKMDSRLRGMSLQQC